MLFQFSSPPTVNKRFLFLHIHDNTGIVSLFNFVKLASLNCYFTMILICISLTSSKIEHRLLVFPFLEFPVHLLPICLKILNEQTIISPLLCNANSILYYFLDPYTVSLVYLYIFASRAQDPTVAS